MLRFQKCTVADNYVTSVIDEEDQVMVDERHEPFVALSTFFDDQEETKNHANVNRKSRYGGVSCYYEAVKYLLRTY